MAENTRETQLRGLATEWRTMTYNWRDCALYALAVGAKGDEPQYTYENGMQAIPTFGATPYWGTVNVTPKLPRPRAIPVLVEELLRPGEGRGMAVRSQVEVFDEGGTLLCTNRCTTLFPTLGGYGGQPMPRGASPIPERDPDLVIDDHIGAAQNLLYRLTGDTNLVHVDRDVAVSRGLDGPFVHDLCAYGYVCRLATAQLFPVHPEKLTRMFAAMKTVLYPDTPVQLHLWKLEEGKAAFRFVNAQTGKPILDRGELEWR